MATAAANMRRRGGTASGLPCRRGSNRDVISLARLKKAVDAACIMYRADWKSQVSQCLGFCSADSKAGLGIKA